MKAERKAKQNTKFLICHPHLECIVSPLRLTKIAGREEFRKPDNNTTPSVRIKAYGELPFFTFLVNYSIQMIQVGNNWPIFALSYN